MWRAVALTLFPEMFPGPLGESLAGRALTEGVWSLEAVDIRRSAKDRHGTVDDAPFGGGAGMVMKPDVLSAAIEAVAQAPGMSGVPKVLLSPRGAPFSQARARELSRMERLMFLCGRYEGYDERIRQGMSWEEISLGDFVLAGGELAAVAVLEAAVRLIPGVLGCAESAVHESFEGEWLDYPQYTRPREFRGMHVPDVLMSGDHAAVARWRLEQAKLLTARKLTSSLTNTQTPADRREPNESP